ncbi:MAG TPA: MgtC/SapB family protein [Steroidobacteraceae bacterium]|nr:MgtC/SapB family protein [Steroidobacteraceae bacterium]
MEPYWNELMAGLPDSAQMARVVVRMLAAALFGAMVGIQRERAGKAAGVRTHMLVSMGGALFVVSCLEWGMDSADMSRVIQGLVTGIGFIGGGAILKLTREREVEGLTTAAGLWMTCAVGIAAGLGRLGAAGLGVVLTVIILGLVGEITHRLEMKKEAKAAARK